MQFTENVGIIATKSELVALLAFTSDSESTSQVSIKLEPGKLIAWATNGHSAAYCHGETWDGKGKPSTETGSWQIPSHPLEMISKAMGKGDECIMEIGRKGQLKQAKIRDIESSEIQGTFGLEDVATTGLLFDLETIAPSRPTRDQLQRCVGAITLAPSLLGLLVKVAKAAGCDSATAYMPTTGVGAVIVEVDTATALQDEEQPRWVCVLMPQGEREVEGHEVDEDSDPAGGDEV